MLFVTFAIEIVLYKGKDKAIPLRGFQEVEVPKFEGT
jgi:hypothetical protein